jgi:hypothetical protein
MKTIRVLLYISLCVASAEALGQTYSPGLLGGPTTVNVNNDAVFHVGSVPSNCQQFQVLSWSVTNKTPSYSNPDYASTTAGMVTLRFSSQGTAQVRISCQCTASGPTIYDQINLTINPTNPTFTFGIQEGNDFCEGTTVTLQGTNMSPASGTKQFTYAIDGTNASNYVYGGTNPSASYNLSGLAPGNHVAYGTMFDNTTGLPSPWYSYSFIIRQKQSFSISSPNAFHINGVVCSGNPVAPVSINVDDPNNLAGAQGFKYHWLINGGESAATTTNYYTYPSVHQNDEIQVRVVDEYGNGCQNSEALSGIISIDVTNTVYPDVHIIASRTSFGSQLSSGDPLCPGSTIYLRSSQQADHYYWSMGGNSLPDAQEVQLTVGGSGAPANQFSSNSLVSMHADGVSGGTCLQPPYNSGLTFVGGSDLSIYELPPSNFTPTGTITIRTDGSQTFTGPNPSTGMAYQWLTFNGSGYDPISGQTSQTFTTSSTGTYKLKTTIPQGCASTSSVSAQLRINQRPTVSISADEASFTLPAIPTATAIGADNDGIVTYTWTKISGPSGTLSNANTSTVSILGAQVGIYVLKVDVNDDLGETPVSGGDYITIYVYPADNYNYVKENVVTIANVADPNSVTGLSIGNRIQTTTYFDGFGRPSEKITMMGTPGMKDFVQPHEYDVFGREKRTYLPYPTTQTAGVFVSNPLQGTTGYKDSPHQVYYQNTFLDSIGYSQSEFDNSPLNRVVGQSSPGLSWKPGSGHTIGKSYLVNVAHEVLFFNYNESTGELTLPANTASDGAYYPANVLYCNTTVDEDQHEVREYKDREGRLVCKKVLASPGVYASTYYIYDDFGHLVVVLPPEGVQKVIETN